MAFSAPVGGVITQTGTDSDLSGLVGNAGVTVTVFDHFSIYDFGTNRLRVDGNLTINGLSAGDREMLVIGIDGATQNVDIDVGPSGVLTVGSIDTQDGVSFNQEKYWPSIFEDASINFTQGRGNINVADTAVDAFLNVGAGGTLNWYGNINCCGGMRFRGLDDGISGVDSNIEIRGGVLDARRMTERGSGEADNFIYNYSRLLDIDVLNGDPEGLTILTAATLGANEKGLAILQLAEPISLRAVRWAFSSQAWGGSNSAPIDLTYTVDDYGGIIGTPGIDNIDLRSAGVASNTSVVTFRNSALGSTLRLATQDPAFNLVRAVQTVTASIEDAAGTARPDAVLATIDITSTIFQDFVDLAGEFDLGDIVLATFNDDNPPTATFLNPSGANDDLRNFYVYSLDGTNQARLNVRLRGVGGTDLEFIDNNDPDRDIDTRLVIEGYANIGNLQRLYNRSKLFKVDNVAVPSIETPVALVAGSIVDIGSLDLILDGTAATFAIAGNTLTINPISAPQIVRVNQTESVVDTPEAASITISVPNGTVDDDQLLLVIGHSESEDNTWTDPAGWVEVIDELQAGGTPASIPGLTVYRRLADSEPSSYIINGSFVSGLVAQMITYRDVDATTPLDVAVTTTSGAAGDPNPPSITPVNNGSMILAIALGDAENSVSSAPAGYSLINETVSTSGGDEGNGAPVQGDQVFTVVGTDTFVVPAGVTSLNIKAWGAGGGGGGAGTAAGSDGGGGGGFVDVTVPVISGETLDIDVGGGGGAGPDAGAGAGGGGGGLTRIRNEAGDVLAVAGAGGGGGGGDNSGGTPPGDRGGAGGGNTGEQGLQNGTSVGGSGGTQLAGGAGGAGNDQTGVSGSSLTGGAGAHDTGTGGGGVGGTINGGEGGTISAGFGAGGGGGAGFFGGGGGGEAQANTGSGTGGGGGSNFVSGTVNSNVQGAATVGAGQADPDFPANTGNGGGTSTAGQRGAVRVEFDVPGSSLDGLTLSTADLRQTTAAIEDPAAFDYADDQEWATATIALRENQSGGGNSSLSPTSDFDTVRTLGDVTVRNGASIDGLSIIGDVTLDEVIDLTNVTINGNLNLQVAGSYAFVNVTVTGDILNNDASGNAIINASGASSISTSEPGVGNGEVSILQVNILTISGLIPGGILTIYDNELPDPNNLDSVLGGQSPVLSTSFDFVHEENNNEVFVQFIAPGFIEINDPFTLLGQAQTLTLNPQLETNI